MLTTISDRRKGIARTDSVTKVGYYLADVQTAQDFYPYGMNMPGRSGYQTRGGWAQGNKTVNGTSMPEILTLESRENDMPPEYKATREVVFTGEYITGTGDEFLAYIADATNTGTGSGGGNGQGVVSGYRYGTNGQERSDEINSNSYSALYWEYDSRTGRRWNIDPVTKDDESGYSTFGSNPIVMSDPDGDDWYKNKKSGQIDWFDGSAKHKGFKNLGVNFRTKSTIAGVTTWYGNSKEAEWQESQLETFTVVGKKKDEALADRTFRWANYDQKKSDEWQSQRMDYNSARSIGITPAQIASLSNLSRQKLSIFEVGWQAKKDGEAAQMYILDFATIFVPVPKVGMLRWLKISNNTFKEAKVIIWAKNVKPVFEPLINENTGKVYKVFAEIHHRYIPQRWGLPNWITNARWNLQITNSIEHAVKDSYRYQFLPKWVKEAVDAGVLKDIYY